MDIFSLISKEKTAKLDDRSVADLKIGESAKITSVGDDCLDIHCHCLRLMELGFTPGQEVTVVAKSPFKDPLAVSVRGTIIDLRSEEAECIKVNLNGSKN